MRSIRVQLRSEVKRANARRAGRCSEMKGRRSEQEVLYGVGDIYAQHLRELGRPAEVYRPTGRSNDDAAKAVVLRLAVELGFDGVEAGGVAGHNRLRPRDLETDFR